MSTPPFNTVAWFQVGSDKPDEVKKFYGDLFGWTFDADPNADAYDLVSYPAGEGPSGGIAHTPDATGNHATFFVLVQDVAATVAAAERLGGKVSVPPVTGKDGLIFAHIQDTSGNDFGIFSPAPQP
ncbi:VOC family protein [Nocardia sp. NPDC004604]|uniref:VOC family protein n=1 Tax=Nocardia sp. NPDC004604 TaxID=3157013 RepID=UPI00339F184D